MSSQACKLVKIQKKKKTRKKKPWQDSKLLDLKKTVIHYGNLLQKQPFNLTLRASFFKYSKDCKKLIKKKKRLYKNELFDKLLNLRDEDPKEYWKLLKLLKYEDSNKQVEIQAGFPEMIKHFKNQGQSYDFDSDFKFTVEDNLKNDTNHLPFNDITDAPFTISEINKCVKKLKTGKSAGPDQITNEIIKFSGVATNKAITKLFNLVLDSGLYPDNWS